MKAFTLSLAFFALSTAAQAVTIPFNGGSDNQSTLNLTQGGTSVTVSAFATDYDAAANTGTIANINRNGNGWGVQGGAENGRIAGGEALVLDFGSTRVSLNSATIFEAGGNAEPFELFIDGILAGSFSTLAASGRSQEEFDFNNLDTKGSVFAFRSTIDNGPGNLGVRLSAIDVTIVPIPASAAFLLTGGAAFAAVSRRRSKRASKV